MDGWTVGQMDGQPVGWKIASGRAPTAPPGEPSPLGHSPLLKAPPTPSGLWTPGPSAGGKTQEGLLSISKSSFSFRCFSAISLGLLSAVSPFPATHRHPRRPPWPNSLSQRCPQCQPEAPESCSRPQESRSRTTQSARKWDLSCASLLGGGGGHGPAAVLARDREPRARRPREEAGRACGFPGGAGDWPGRKTGPERAWGN
ncbi:uncharacterized protein LOC116578166 [Mustela erminea]|uniref:uncharacterized protein LOC116578166 n=1 Tax=Mustela erminea TaxID=36723 RepID=UPI001386D899|nr:uncharacterized protein LOC116578166 [Mustela erminea]